MEAGCAVCKPRGMGNGIACFQDGRSSAMVRRGLSWGLSPRAVCGKGSFVHLERGRMEFLGISLWLNPKVSCIWRLACLQAR